MGAPISVGPDEIGRDHTYAKVQISTFVVRCLDSIICMLALSKVSRF